MPDSTEPKTLTLPLVWRNSEVETSELYVGPMRIGEIYEAGSGKWNAFSRNLFEFSSRGHLTREAAMEALEAAVKELERG